MLQTLEERYSSEASDYRSWLLFILTVLVGSIFGVVLTAFKSARRATLEYSRKVSTVPMIPDPGSVERMKKQRERKAANDRRETYNRIAAGDVADDDKQLFFKYEKIRKEHEAKGMPAPPPYNPFDLPDKETRTRKG